MREGEGAIKREQAESVYNGSTQGLSLVHTVKGDLETGGHLQSGGVWRRNWRSHVTRVAVVIRCSRDRRKE